MARKRSTILLTLLLIGLLVFGILYFVRSFFASFAPAEIEITKTEISSPEGFVNPVTIEKLRVDSLGKDHRPVKYSVEYLTTCSIKQEDGKSPVPLNTIKFDEAGRYSWSEEKIHIPIVHNDGYSLRRRMDSIQSIIWSVGSKRLDICPLRFEKKSWYFLNFLNPQVVGIYVYIDSGGTLKQYPAYSGVSPI